MKIEVKKLNNQAVIPEYASKGDAGLDLTAISMEYNKGNGVVTFGTGLAIEIPDGHVGLLFPRSSVYKTGLSLCNSVGVIDSGYRGEIKLKFYLKGEDIGYKVGDRVGQLVVLPCPKIEFRQVVNLDSSERGDKGFGSTGN